MAGKLNNANSFTVNFPKRRYEAKNKNFNFVAKEVDSTVKVKGENTYIKDFKVYRELESFNTQLKRHETESTLVQEGIATLEEATKLVDQLVSQ